jgi:hypothetical protein
MSFIRLRYDDILGVPNIHTNDGLCAVRTAAANRDAVRDLLPMSAGGVNSMS